MNNHMNEYNDFARDLLKIIELDDELSNPSVHIQDLKDPRPEVRVHGAVMLGEIKDPQTLPYLVETLEDTDPEVRYWTARSLGEIKDPRAVPNLVKALKDPNGKVKCGAAYALGKIEDQRAIPGLLETLYDVDAECRSAWALGQINDTKAVMMLLDKYEKVPEEDEWGKMTIFDRIEYLNEQTVLVKKLYSQLKANIQETPQNTLYEEILNRVIVREYMICG